MGLCFYLGTTFAGAMYILGTIEIFLVSALLWADCPCPGTYPKGGASRQACLPSHCSLSSGKHSGFPRNLELKYL